MDTNNTELIAAKDLPVTTEEEVDVLCVEPDTGELKKKSGANLGGSGGVMIVNIVPAGDEYTTDKSYADVKAAIDKGQIVVLYYSNKYYNLSFLSVAMASFVNISYTQPKLKYEKWDIYSYNSNAIKTTNEITLS